MQIDDAQLKRIVSRYMTICENYGWGRSIRESEGESRLVVEMHLRNWHKREPLNFTILEHFPDLDFIHDLGGIMRDDTLMSARSALAYHPIR